MEGADHPRPRPVHAAQLQGELAARESRTCPRRLSLPPAQSFRFSVMCRPPPLCVPFYMILAIFFGDIPPPK